MKDRELLEILTACLAENYGIGGQLSRLPGENFNFLVTAADGTKHVFKIVDEDMPPAVIELENAVIEYAAAVFRPRLPQVVRNKYGKLETRIDIRTNSLNRARLIEFIPGVEMSNLSDISDTLLFGLGTMLAEFDLVLEKFHHPAAKRSHRWNLAEAERHEDKVALISEREKRDLLGWSFAGWRQARPVLASVPWQVIHGDAHDENVLVEGQRVSGLIDFGDCCHNPAVCDLAICLAYLMMRGENPLRVAAVIVDGYRRVRPLSAAEIGLLYPLACARLAVSVCVAGRRKTIDPGNPNWFGGERAAWGLLGRLRLLGPEAFRSRLQRSN